MKQRKITDPSQLKAGMRVEYKYEGDVYKGVLECWLGISLHLDEMNHVVVQSDGAWGYEIKDVYQILDEPRTIEDLERAHT